LSRRFSRAQRARDERSESRRGARGAVSPSWRITAGAGGREVNSPATRCGVYPSLRPPLSRPRRGREERSEWRRGGRGTVGRGGAELAGGVWLREGGGRAAVASPGAAAARSPSRRAAGCGGGRGPATARGRRGGGRGGGAPPGARPGGGRGGGTSETEP